MVILRQHLLPLLTSTSHSYSVHVIITQIQIVEDYGTTPSIRLNNLTMLLAYILAQINYDSLNGWLFQIEFLHGKRNLMKLNYLYLMHPSSVPPFSKCIRIYCIPHH